MTRFSKPFNPSNSFKWNQEGAAAVNTLTFGSSFPISIDLDDEWLISDDSDRPDVRVALGATGDQVLARIVLLIVVQVIHDQVLRAANVSSPPDLLAAPMARMRSGAYGLKEHKAMLSHNAVRIRQRMSVLTSHIAIFLGRRDIVRSSTTGLVAVPGAEVSRVRRALRDMTALGLEIDAALNTRSVIHINTITRGGR